MRDAVLELGRISETSLYETVAEGVPLIVDNAESLEGTARRLFSAEEYRASDIVRGFAEEEAAKVLILLDAVRCPTERRQETLKCFDNHLAKRIYALTCSYPNIASFGELNGLIELERQPFYLDGPNTVDWIFANSITTERERAIYVDYVKDITERSGGYAWIAPDTRSPFFTTYRPPESVELCRALCEAGAKWAEGVAVIADAWRGFELDEGTSRDDLQDLIVSMLNALLQSGHGVRDEAARDRIVSSWSFPLWPFGLSRKPRGKTLEELRQERRRAIEWIEKTERRRDPPPLIDKAKVEAMGGAYAAWRTECDQVAALRRQGKKGSLSLRELAGHRELDSYQRLKGMFAELDDDERAALLALAWFTQATVGDWPETYQRARSSAASLSWSYQIGKGWHWLAGFARWEAPPSAFRPGRRSTGQARGK